MPELKQQDSSTATTGLGQEVNLETLNVAFMTIFNRYYLVISVVCMVIVLLAIGLGIVPTWKEIGTLRRQIAANQNEEAKLNKKLDQLALLTADDSPFASQSAFLDSTLYSYKPFLETLYAISNASSLNQVSIEKFEFMPGLVATQAAEVANSTRNVVEAVDNDLHRRDQYVIFEITAVGGLMNVAQFINDLERSAPVANVSVGTLTQSDRSTTAKLEVYVYYYNRELEVALGAALPILDDDSQNAADFLPAFIRPDLSVLGQQSVQGGGKHNLFLPYGSYSGLYSNPTTETQSPPESSAAAQVEVAAEAELPPTGGVE